MLKTCVYCGRLHDSKTVCEQKPKRGIYSRSEKLCKFRNSSKWKRKREEIKKRDKNICIYCFFDKKSSKKFNAVNLSVHHIDGLEEAYEKRLDNNNLVTLCRYHHELADAGKITKSELIELLKSTPRGAL